MFYQEVQKDTKLDVSGALLTPEAFLLAASIAANIGTLKKVHFADYRFKAYFQRVVAELVKSISIEDFEFIFYPEDGLDTLAMLTRSPSILSINFSNCSRQYILDVAKALAGSPASHRLQELNFNNNDIEKYGSDTAEELINIDSLRKVRFGLNGLKKYAVSTAKAFAKSSSLQELDLFTNGIEQYGPDTGAELAKSRSLSSIKLQCNKLGKYAPKTAEALARSHSLEEVDLSLNALEHHAPATAKALVKSTSLKKVIMKGIYPRGEANQEIMAKTREVFEEHNKPIQELKELLTSTTLIADGAVNMPVDVMGVVQGFMSSKNEIEFEID